MEISEEFYAHVDKVAKSTSYKWTDLDWEDIRQDMWVYLLERPGEYGRMVEDSWDDCDKKLRRIGSQVAVATLNAYELYSGQYVYGRDEVRGLLEEGVPFNNEDIGTVTERTDLTLALLDLKETNPAQFELITNRYFKGWYDSSISSVKMMMQRGLDNLTLKMNQVHNAREYTYESGPGARKVLSNSTSVAITGGWE